MHRVCSRDGEKRNEYRVLVGKRPVERPRYRWKNIKIYLRETG
jgi:hypothetical protein